VGRAVSLDGTDEHFTARADNGKEGIRGGPKTKAARRRTVDLPRFALRRKVVSPQRPEKTRGDDAPASVGKHGRRQCFERNGWACAAEHTNEEFKFCSVNGLPSHCGFPLFVNREKQIVSCYEPLSFLVESCHSLMVLSTGAGTREVRLDDAI
jgi:hypothetical protein